MNVNVVGTVCSIIVGKTGILYNNQDSIQSGVTIDDDDRYS